MLNERQIFFCLVKSKPLKTGGQPYCDASPHKVSIPILWPNIQNCMKRFWPAFVVSKLFYTFLPNTVFTIGPIQLFISLLRLLSGLGECKIPRHKTNRCIDDKRHWTEAAWPRGYDDNSLGTTKFMSFHFWLLQFRLERRRRRQRRRQRQRS